MKTFSEALHALQFEPETANAEVLETFARNYGGIVAEIANDPEALVYAEVIAAERMSGCEIEFPKELFAHIRDVSMSALLMGVYIGMQMEKNDDWMPKEAVGGNG